MLRYTNQDARDGRNSNEATQRVAFGRTGFVLKKIMLAALIVFAMSAFAQLGPAGVPGAPGLAPDTEEAANAQVKSKRAPLNCSKAKNVKQCKARQKARKAKKTKQPGSTRAAGKRSPLNKPTAIGKQG